MAPPVSALDRGREAFDRQHWGEAYTHLRETDATAPLGAADLERFATAAHLLGHNAEAQAALTRGFRLLAGSDAAGAARFAFWMAFALESHGEHAPSAGWAGRGRRLLEEARLDCVEHGYLLLPKALQQVREGNPAGAMALFAEAAGIGQRFGDQDLATLARHGQGRALISQGDAARGVALLDEIMVAVTSGEVSPVIAGVVYCSVISACHDLFDLRRAREWTEALTRWCSEQPDLVLYQGQCLVRRSELLRLRGAWTEAMAEAERACRRLADPPGQPDAGTAWYQRGELHRLLGKFEEAEAAYREADRLGRRPWPGLALLRLAQGQHDAARTALRRVLDEARDRRTRALTLPAFVDVALATGDIAAAGSAADALRTIAAEVNTPLLQATAHQASGAVLLAEGNIPEALTALREAWRIWTALEAPYEAALVRVLIGQACRRMGDADAAELELSSARRVFEELGAVKDLARVDGLDRPETGSGAGGLTARELEVLRLVASGGTNRAIASELSISEKTVARHLSNIFLKLGLSSRAAATAWAYQHHLV